MAPHSASGEDAVNTQCLWHRGPICASLGLCMALEAVPVCTYTSQERQHLTPGTALLGYSPRTAAELFLQAASGSQCMNRQCPVPFKSNAWEWISSWVKKNRARDMKKIKSLKKVALVKQEWNSRLYGKGKGKQLAAIMKTPVRNFQGANGNQPQRTASRLLRPQNEGDNETPIYCLHAQPPGSKDFWFCALKDQPLTSLRTGGKHRNVSCWCFVDLFSTAVSSKCFIAVKSLFSPCSWATQQCYCHPAGRKTERKCYLPTHHRMPDA